MPVPWEAFIPFGAVTVMFGVAGTLVRGVAQYRNNGYDPRYNVDNWDEMMMARDQRLTGKFRGQTTDPAASEGFAIGLHYALKK